MYWETILKEVLNKTSESQAFVFTSVGEEQRKKVKLKTSKATIKKSPRKKLLLTINVEDHSIYLTLREAQVVYQLLGGKTLAGVANELELSRRTVEFYVKNIKMKLRCQTKSDLIGKIFNSDFLRNYNTLFESNDSDEL